MISRRQGGTPSSVGGVPGKPRRDPAEVAAAVERVLSGEHERADLALAVRGLAEQLAHRSPGRSVELRVPPFTAVQLRAGPRHTRGTPPNVCEVDPMALVQLCAGQLAWRDAVADGRVRTSGERADLSDLITPAGD
jgi:hypothetical protein